MKNLFIATIAAAGLMTFASCEEKGSESKNKVDAISTQDDTTIPDDTDAVPVDIDSTDSSSIENTTDQDSQEDSELPIEE